jgi:RND family efflux transporter MFP subunit
MRENEVRLAEANLTLNRVRQLFADKLVTQAEVDRAQAEVDSIEARIAAAREQVIVTDRQVALSQTNLDDTIIRAPFSGIAISKNAQPGEIISPMSAGGGFTRTGICTIVDMSSLEVEVDVNESYIGRVVPGQGVAATLDAYPDWQIPARVITTVPTADRQKATVLVRIAFNELDARILPDMGVKVTFLRDPDQGEQATRPVALVPRAVLRQDGDRTIVFVIRPENVVERRAITTGGTDGDRVEVVAGLNSGERVVVSPPPDLADGAPVVVN